jgi:Tol biopolymer transport system component/DNA-binding winged helix-turn-helix (wHTH) protein
MSPSPASYKFGPYRMDMRAGELRRNGYKVRLQEKQFLLLAALAGQHGQVVTRDELKRHLWSGDTFVDFETGLNTAISKLREALSDDPQKPRFIETMPRRGYRFIFPVELAIANGQPAGAVETVMAAEQQSSVFTEVLDAGCLGLPSSDSSLTMTAQNSVTNGRESKARVWSIVAVTFILGVFAFALWWLTPLPDPRLVNIFPVTATGKQDFLVTPATDGARIFYVQRASDHYELMQSSVDGGEAKKMEAPFPNTLMWDTSPDGSQYLITSFVHRGEAAPLWSWPAKGGTPQRLGDLISGSAAWSPDGKNIVYHAGKNLGIANADGSGARLLGTFQQEPDSPAWSPDGQRIRFTLKDLEHNSSSIWQIAADGSGLRPTLPNWMNPQQVCCGTWTRDGRYFFFVEFADQIPHLWALREKGPWWRRNSAGPFQIASGPTGSWSPLVGRDGKHIYFYVYNGAAARSMLEAVNVATQEFSAILPEYRPVMPGFSRDGQQVAFVQFSTDGLWLGRADGTDFHHIQIPELNVAFPRWSPDGQKIAFAGAHRGEAENTYLISAQGGEAKPVLPGIAGLINPDWSADGSRLVVERSVAVSSGGNPNSTLAFVDLRNARIEEIPGSENLSSPRWSPDGKFIGAISEDGHNLKIYDIAANRWRIAARGQSLGIPAWSADGTFLYYQDLTAAGQPLFRVNANSGAKENVTSFQKILDTGIHRCAFMALLPNGTPIVTFGRGDADIYGATLILP